MRFERERREPKDERATGEHWRARVEYDDDYGYTLLADEQLTSSKQSALILRATTFEYTKSAVRWLAATFGELVTIWGAEERHAEAPVAPPQPVNDLSYIECLKLVARDAKAVRLAFEENESWEHVADAMGPLGDSIARLKREEGRVVPIRRVS